MKSLYHQDDYSQDWVKDFYTQAGIWWGEDPQAQGTHVERIKSIERLCGTACARTCLLTCAPAGYRLKTP